MKRIFWAALVAIALLSATHVSAQLTGPVVQGSVTLDGANPSSTTTGLRTLTSCVVSLYHAGAAAHGHTSKIFTVQFTPSSSVLDIFAWNFTSSGDNTLIGSTSSTDIVYYICRGDT